MVKILPSKCFSVQWRTNINQTKILFTYVQDGSLVCYFCSLIPVVWTILLECTPPKLLMNKLQIKFWRMNFTYWWVITWVDIKIFFAFFNGYKLFSPPSPNTLSHLYSQGQCEKNIPSGNNELFLLTNF